jgi:hypothetical protein
MDGKMLARLGAIVFVAIAITATAIEMTRKEDAPASSGLSARQLQPATRSAAREPAPVPAAWRRPRATPNACASGPRPATASSAAPAPAARIADRPEGR